MFYVPLKRPNSLEKLNMPYLGRLLTNFVQIPLTSKAAAAFKGVSAIYWPILFKFGAQIVYWQPFSVCFVAFTIKGQTKAAVAFKGVLAIYWSILFKFDVDSLFATFPVCFTAFTIKGQTKATAAFKCISVIHCQCFQIWPADSLSATVLGIFHKPVTKRSKKATAAVKSNIAIYWLILFKFGVQTAYWQWSQFFHGLYHQRPNKGPSSL